MGRKVNDKQSKEIIHIKRLKGEYILRYLIDRAQKLFVVKPTDAKWIGTGILLRCNQVRRKISYYRKPILVTILEDSSVPLNDVDGEILEKIQYVIKIEKLRFPVDSPSGIVIPVKSH